ncbi:hypothetical protein TTHERM_000805817 (macronuclear) [Tetrahymena thermophila SB210]|uniref:Uncharacterized protein n=1 Tax=Tetrahymena thermophila (strain SB210) TaxID=312017 RepID=W7XJE4_TETTS|nr:hypothetical protein TTHERM_000805817 [Tetrahymena thermophila SB210]EWS75451.1 hypothetical protein TTHERM_000805817 [Tetrahymena thermophila SB210]|eukprot:XP_012651998.1 hypothetical protein TTHERM_000805817 [Tetrahymena thermophila SB210]
MLQKSIYLLIDQYLSDTCKKEISKNLIKIFIVFYLTNLHQLTMILNIFKQLLQNQNPIIYMAKQKNCRFYIIQNYKQQQELLNQKTTKIKKNNQNECILEQLNILNNIQIDNINHRKEQRKVIEMLINLKTNKSTRINRQINKQLKGFDIGGRYLELLSMSFQQEQRDLLQQINKLFDKGLSKIQLRYLLTHKLNENIDQLLFLLISELFQSKQKINSFQF